MGGNFKKLSDFCYYDDDNLKSKTKIQKNIKTLKIDFYISIIKIIFETPI